MPIRPIKPKAPTDSAPALGPVRQRTRPAHPPTISPSEGEPAEAASSNPEPDYEVGYGKPPLANRFKPGQSGNPRGRPKAAKGLNTIVRETLTQKVAVRTAAGEKRISRIEAALHKAVELAMKGNPRAIEHLLRLYASAVPDTKPAADQQTQDEDLTATDLAMLEELRLMLGDAREDSE